MARTDTVTRGRSFQLEDGRYGVTVCEITTPKGRRLEIASDVEDTSVRLDPLELESLSWQPTATYPGEPDGDDEVTSRGPEVRLSNEFADVDVAPVETSDGPRLEIVSTKLGYDVRLAPGDLDWVTRQDVDAFTEMLEDPFGPGGEVE